MSADASETILLAPINDILAYWFEHLDDTRKLDMQSRQCRRWHAKDPETDREITQRFGATYRACRQSSPPATMTPRDRVALVLLFDQFTRNLFRDKPKMYEVDDVALALTEEGIKRRDDEALPLIYRIFLYMPMMHSESISYQERTVELFHHLVTLAEEKSPQNRGFFEMAAGYAVQHRDIVASFNRFPHRNSVLGRGARLKKSGSWRKRSHHSEDPRPSHISSG